MALPSAVATTFLDAASDDVAQARTQIYAAVVALNDLLTHLGLSPLTSDPLTVGEGLEDGGASLRTLIGFLTKTTAYTAVAADRGKIIDFTTAGVTLSLTAAATLTNGWYVWVRNSASSGDITIDPNSTETIDGATTIALAPGESALIMCNGTLFRSAGRGLSAATAADQETATSTSKYVSPGVQHRHPSAAKAWASVSNPAGTPSINASYNVSGLTDNGAGNTAINFTTSFSSTSFASIATPTVSGARWSAQDGGRTTGSANVETYNSAGSIGDVGFNWVGFGDQ